ncbi:MAG TPA: hypothetical protein VK891_01580 [Euzebyales bacterium]|nr:hypothetical protein [Euzebyales bacterium]
MTWEQAHGAAGARRWLPLIAGLLMAAAIALVVVRGGDRADTLAVQERADTPASTPPASVAAPEPERPTAEPVDASAGSGPLLRGGADFAIVAADHTGWRVIEVATGAVTRWRLRGLGEQTLSSTMFVSGDDLVVSTGLGPADVLRVAPDGDAVTIAEQREAVHTIAAGEAVWVHDGLSDDVGGQASLITPDGGVRERIDLPSLTVPAVGVGERLVVTTRSGSAVVSADDGVRRIRDEGVVVAADERRIAHVVCDRQRRCEVLVGTPERPDQHRLLLAPGDVPGGYFGPELGAFSPDGRWLALPVFTQSSRGYLVIVDTATGERMGRPEGSDRPFTSALAWSPDSRWLIFAAGEGIDAWDADTGGVVKLDREPVQALAIW